MDIEVLVSTMNLSNQKELLKKLKVNESVIINQTSELKLEDIDIGKNRLYSYREKGLSKSRNKALKKSQGDICIIADDDLTYEERYEQIIKKGYEKYPKADIIAFYVDNYNQEKRRPIRKEGKLNFIRSMQIQSVQITFKRKKVIDNDIFFNEKFGTGAEFYMGEENIFLAKCLKKGLKIYYIPEKIATIQDNDSTWFSGFNESYFNVRGAVFYEISRFWYFPLIIQFAFRKRKNYKNDINVIRAIKYMLDGVKKYKKECL